MGYLGEATHTGVENLDNSFPRLSREAAKCSANVTSWFLDQVDLHLSLDKIISWTLGRETRRCGGSSTGKLPRVYDTLQVTDASDSSYRLSFCSGVAGAGLALTPINHSFTGQEIAKQVNLAPMLLFYIQVEAASSKWVVTDTSSKRRIFEALGENCTPAFISTNGEKHLSSFQI